MAALGPAVAETQNTQPECMVTGGAVPRIEER
jgi:hypothetical protein